jgi:hypothetical protein
MKKKKLENPGINTWKDFYYEFHDLIRKIYNKIEPKFPPIQILRRIY